MNAERTTVRRIAVGLAVAAALVTSGCAAGQVAGTADQKTTLDGTNVDVGGIALRGLAIETPDAVNFPVGSNLLIKVVIVNDSTSNDTLTGISSSAAASWGAYDSEDALTAATSLTPGTDSSSDSASPAGSTGAAPSGSTPSGSIPSGTLPSTSTSSSSDATAQAGVSIGRGLAVSYGVPVANGKVLALTGTNKALYPGATVPITFTFAKAGSKTFAVPIQLSDDGSYTPSPEYLPSEGSSEGTG